MKKQDTMKVTKGVRLELKTWKEFSKIAAEMDMNRSILLEAILAEYIVKTTKKAMKKQENY